MIENNHTANDELDAVNTFIHNALNDIERSPIQNEMLVGLWMFAKMNPSAIAEKPANAREYFNTNIHPICSCVVDGYETESLRDCYDELYKENPFIMIGRKSLTRLEFLIWYFITTSNEYTVQRDQTNVIPSLLGLRLYHYNLIASDGNTAYANKARMLKSFLMDTLQLDEKYYNPTLDDLRNMAVYYGGWRFYIAPKIRNIMMRYEEDLIY